MKCPDCGKYIDITNLEKETYICSNCKKDVTEIVRDKREYLVNSTFEIQKFVKGIIFGGILAMVILILLFKIITFNLGNIYINGLIGSIKTTLLVLLITGIIIFIVCLVLFVNKKRNKIIRNFWIVSVIIIIIPLIILNMVKIDGHLSLTNYTTKEYIEIGSEKIPTVYSAVGKRKIIFSTEEKNYYDSGLLTNMDLVAIIYRNLSDSDKNVYINKLLDSGFREEELTDENGDKYFVYIKEDYINNKCYSVGIDNLSITYTVFDGRYYDIVKKALEASEKDK